MKRLLTGLLALAATSTALAHNYVMPKEAPAGYVHDITMRVPHGCKGIPVNQVRIKIPEGMLRVTTHHREDWDVTVKMRKLDPPIKVEGGAREITETVDEIIWSNPKSVLPPDRIGEFRFRGMLPNEPGRILFFRTLNDCDGGDDYYVDLPADELNLDDPDFHKKFWAFLTATATPAPYLILTKPERPQYPWEWESLEDRRPGPSRD